MVGNPNIWKGLLKVTQNDWELLGQNQTIIQKPNLKKQKKRKNLAKKVTACPHKDKKHYAKVIIDITLESVFQLLPFEGKRQEAI